MKRSGAVQQIATLLQREGRADLVGELEGLISASSEAYIKTIADVTRALLENEGMYRLVLSDEMDPMSLFDAATGMFLDVNDAWVELYGYSREEALAMHVTAISAEPAETRKAIAQLAPGSSTRINLRWHRAKDGTVFPVELTSGKLTLGDRPVFYAVMRDITQRQAAERELARSEASFRALVECMPDGVFVHRFGDVVYTSPSGRRMLGYGLEDRIAPSTVLELVHPGDREKVRARWTEMRNRGAPAPPAVERLLHRDGSSVTVEIAAHTTLFDGRQAVLAIAREATARGPSDPQLMMAERLVSLGRQALAIAQELNDPLTDVLGTVKLVDREMARAGAVLDQATSARLRQLLRSIQDGAARMRDVVRLLTRLAR